MQIEAMHAYETVIRSDLQRSVMINTPRWQSGHKQNLVKTLEQPLDGEVKYPHISSKWANIEERRATSSKIEMTETISLEDQEA